MKDLLAKLQSKTPNKNVVIWVLTTCLYAFSILINEQFHLIHDIGLSAQVEAIIKMLGAYLYIFITALNFSQTTKKIGGDQPPPDKDDK